MKSLVNLLLSLALLHFLAAPAARGPTGSKAVARQSETDSTLTPTTVEGRQNAVKELEAAVSAALSEGRTIDAARGLARKGNLQTLLSDPNAAIASHTQALDLLRETPNAEIEVDNRVGVASAYMFIPKKDELAQQNLNQAIDISRQVNYTRGEAEALLTLSDLQNRTNHALAVTTGQEALARWTSLDDKDGLGRTYIQIGTYYFAQTLLSEATENATRALEIWRALNNKARQAEALVMLGYIEHKKDDWQTEIDRLTEAHAMLDENAEPFKMGQVCSGLGAAFNESGLFDDAIVQYQRALEFYRRSNYRIAVDYALWGLGRAYYLKGDLTQAYNYLQQSLESQADVVSGALGVEYLGRVHLDRGEYPAAIEKLESALNIYSKAGNPKEAARVLALLGRAYDQQGVVARASSYYTDALQRFTKLEDRVNEAAVYYALGRLELKQKNYDAAGVYLQKSVEVTENIRRVSTSDDLTTAFSATVQERYEAYIDCLMKKHQQQPAAGFAVKAFETSELGRVRALSERLNAIQTNTTASVDPQLASQEKSLRLSLRAMENAKIKLLGNNAREDLKTLEEQIARLESNYKEISDKLRTQDPSFDEISKPRSWDLQQIRQQILRDDDAVIVEFSLGAENSYAWTVTRDNMKSFQLPAQNIISDAARQVYGLLSSEPNAETDKNLAQATAQLSDLALKPLSSELNKQRIIVVADGALNYIPFQLLPLNAVDGQPLISRYEVVNVPSVSVLGQLRQERSKRPAPDQVLAAFGDPVFPADYAQRTGSNPSVLAAGIQPGALTTLHRALRDVEIAGDSFDLSAVQRLIYSERELANLRQISGPQSLIASGFDASRESLEKTDLSHYAILHLATHAVFDPKRPEISGFLLSLVDRKGNPLDGFMTLEDVYRLQAPVDLVVLSACRTGLGKDVRGEGLIGLTRGFMHAGASSVAASLWNVDDEATSELMKFFYANMLQKRMAPAAALRDAQNAIRQQPRWRSPHFWAAFTLHGEYNETIRTRPESEFSRNMIIGTAALFVLALLSYWYLRRSKSAREVKTT